MVLKHLASGGMADVLLARTDGVQGFERHVVLKRIRSEHAKDERFIEMFVDEARLAAQLHHQNIVQVHDIGEANGDYFFAMEYLHGEDLRSLLSKTSKAKQHMPLGHVVSIVSAVAAGLHHANERKGPDKKPLNVVHRDVSPSNVIIGYDGSVKIVDFGIAKAAMRQVETRSGSLKGKVSYMSPEQCKMTSIDRRSDIYALGVVLYEMATTTRLFKNDSDYLVMDAICNGKIPLPRVRRADLPNELAMIIMTALSTEPDRRYQTAEELRSALDAFAIKAGIASNAGALATYMRKLFGEKPEPWLELARKKDPTQPPPQFADTLAAIPESGRSWSDMAAMGSGAFEEVDEAVVDPQAKTKSDRKSVPFAEAKTASGTGSKRRAASQPTESSPAAEIAAAAVEPGQAASPGRVEDRTSTRMAWEQEGAVPETRARPPVKKLAMYAAPGVVIAGLLVWKLASGGGGGSEAASTTPSPAPAVAAATAPSSPTTVTPLPPDPPKTVAPAPAPAPAAALPPPAPAAAPLRDATVDKAAAAAKDTKKKPTDKVAIATTTPTPTKAAVPAVAAPMKKDLVAPDFGGKTEAKPTPAAPPPVAVAAAPAKVEAPKVTPPPVAAPTPPVAAPTPPPAPAITAPAAPVVVETPALAKLSQGSIANVASQHSRELSKCEGTADLHGEIIVRFEVNAAGRVVKSQVSTTLKNPKVTGCILMALRTWQFPKPSTGGGAEGTYTMSYQ